VVKKMEGASEDKITEIEGSPFSSQPVGYLLGKFGLLIVLAGTWFTLIRRRIVPAVESVLAGGR
jgi:hypothetical protein